MKVSHTPAATSATFDDPNLVSAAGLVPILALADNAGLHTLADKPLSVPPATGA
ncbi:MAG: IS1380 family transposase, partial [Brevibacterium sp.]|nr:IS1380 family transposase [Brevibacterium sp.]